MTLHFLIMLASWFLPIRFFRITFISYKRHLSVWRNFWMSELSILCIMRDPLPFFWEKLHLKAQRVILGFWTFNGLWLMIQQLFPTFSFKFLEWKSRLCRGLHLFLFHLTIAIDHRSFLYSCIFYFWTILAHLHFDVWTVLALHSSIFWTILMHCLSSFE